MNDSSSGDRVAGIHHVTAIAGDAQRNLDFYAGVLGLRLVKRTVNFDDPFTYHFYYGDEQGSPGSILTFFPWANVRRGRQGTGQATACAFRIPVASLGFWINRFVARGVEFDQPARRFDEQVISFHDPDKLPLELVAADADDQGWGGGTVPAAHAIRDIYGVTLCVEALEHTKRVLIDTLGFRQLGEENSRTRFVTGDGGSSRIVDVHCAPDLRHGTGAGGTIHHIAFRAADDAAQARWRERIAEAGLNVTPVLDRQYFHSIYFREPGGVLYEIATDPPGFAIDEQTDNLGAHLKLPSWLEPNRELILARLPRINVPGATHDETTTSDKANA